MRWVETSSLRLLKDSYSDIPVWMNALGIGEYSTIASIGALALLGIWVWRHRTADLLLLLGVAAVTARIWTKHLLYDDMLLFVPMIVLWRLGRESGVSDAGRTGALGLFFCNWAVQMAPVSVLQMGEPWRLSFQVSQTVLWALTLAFLTTYAGGRFSRDRVPGSVAD